MNTYVSSITAAGTTFFLPFDESHQWELSAGFVGPVQGWVMPSEIAIGIMDVLGNSTGADREISISFGNPDDLVNVLRVVVLGTGPADNPQRMTLYMTDVRWYFTRAWFLMDVNIRQRLGSKRLIGDVLTDTTIADDIAYYPWSMVLGLVPYNFSLLKDQALYALTWGFHGRPGIDYTTDEFSITFPVEAVQETTSDAPGHIGLARSIEAVPGAGLYVDLAGKIHIFDRIPGAEVPMVEALPPDLEGHGDLVFVDNSSIRPSLWRIYVDYEVEVRFTYNASGAGFGGPPGSNDPFLEPVLQVTDQSLTVDGTQLGQGSWIRQSDAFTAWGGASWAGVVTLPTLTDTIVANHWYGDALQRYTIGDGLGTHDPVWSARIDELMRTWRTHFRVNKNFWDLVRRAFATRAAIWDPTSGTRAPSPVYCNYNKTPLDPFASALVKVLGVNVTDSYPTTGLLADGRPSGFRVQIVDEELGIIAINRDISKFAGHSKVAPSPVVTQAAIDDVTLRENVFQKLAPSDTGADAWKLATILSCVPAAPNDLGRMYEIQVNIADAATAAGLAVPPTGFGPDQELRSQLADARIAWRDESSDAIFSMFGADNLASGISFGGSVTSVNPINLDNELLPLAKSLAASDLLTKLDRYQGTKMVPMNRDLVPIGSVDRVIHKVNSSRAVTVIHCTPHAEPVNAINFMHGAARSYLLKEVASRR